ncbi:MAG: KamA family radical SAM protein [Kiritimatiellia bacterium]
MPEFPEYACPYAQRLAAVSRRFARQVYDGPARGRPSSDRYPADPFGELAHVSKCGGLKQRFPDRVLIMTSDRCFMNCRHCTRRGILGQAQVVRTEEELERCVDYVRAHPKVRDVLLSGGDVLTLPDRAVLRFVEAFAALRQVEIVRVCTRAPSANPGRITAKLAKALGKTKKVWVNTQFNCADELTPEARAAAARLVEAGIPVSCQTVLLKGVNDSTAEMLKLLRALSAARIRPYYVFTCDPIAGIDHFRVPIEKARLIERQCAESIGGLSLPRFVCDIPGAARKVPVGDVSLDYPSRLML